MKFQDQVVCITGAGRGIGYELAKAFTAEGAQVVIAEINPDTGQAAADQLNATYEPL
ncbi:MAG TPA: SDR family NAD(P)-dependent oxidoreductase, partial [Spirillospora sp.]|nr:SDR family NAD(P)-dependent oxidoreductase [Spirillospora sp.]